jgi:ankyrin repeat protein
MVCRIFKESLFSNLILLAKFDKYLNQLKDALADYVRTNNPSRLFRRTRLLLVKCEEKPPPLNEAIQRGYIDLALALIEQVIEMQAPNGLLKKEDENGQTPLLVAAANNQWTIIEIILNKRPDLAEQKDKNGNNVFHLLANLSEDDKAAETMQNVMKILSNDVKVNLLKAKNENNQTPIEIAQSNGNTQYVNLLNDVGKNNV